MIEPGKEAMLVEEQPLNSAAPSVGATLRAAREELGLQLPEMAQILKLGPRQVEALEADDWSSLPGRTFVRGFVRNYARQVRLDPDALLAMLADPHEVLADTLTVPTSAPTEMPSASNRRDRLVVTIGVLFVVLAALAYLFMPGDLSVWRDESRAFIDGFSAKPAAESTAVTPAPAAEPAFPPGATAQSIVTPQLPPLVSDTAPDAATSTPAPVAPPAAVAVAGPAAAPVVPPALNAAPLVAPTAPAATAPAAPAQALRFVVTRESWLEVRDRDNQVVFSQRLLAGSEQTVGGKGPLSLTIGFAPGVRVFLRGQPVDLQPHTRGDVARLVLE